VGFAGMRNSMESNYTNAILAALNSSNRNVNERNPRCPKLIL
jgi:hypothetical protein